MLKSKYFYITLALGLFLGLLPTIILFLKYGFYPKVPVELVDDTLFYYSRVKEVIAGNYFIGNSYIMEYIGSITPAFFVADIIYALPFILFYILGFSFNFGIIFSQILWVLITSVLLYLFYKKIDISEKYIPIGVVVSILSVFMFILRPVTMAVVYPGFLLFLISFYLWVKNPSGRKENIFLVLSAVFGFYLYTYLWQINLVILGLVFFYSLLKKEKRVQTIFILLSTFFLSIPVFIYTFKQITNPFYFETLKRTGLINTHTLGGASIIYVFVIFVCLIILFLLNKKQLVSKEKFLFFNFVFLSLLITGLSNVITGKDLELAIHIGRFTELFVSIFLIYLFFAYKSQKFLINKKILFLSSLIFIYIISLLFINQKGFFSLLKNEINNENYVGVLSQIDNLTTKSEVIFSNEDLSSYITVMTKDYVLFNPKAHLYLMPDKELEERYLVSKMFENITKDQIKNDYRKYAGVGNAIHEANVANRKARICLIFKKVFFELNCPVIIYFYDIKGSEYFDNLEKQYSYILKNKEKFLEKYNVEFIILDKVLSTSSNYVRIRSYEEVWRDENFIILHKK